MAIRGFSRVSMAAALLLALQAPAPARAQDLFTKCYQLYTQLKASDIVAGMQTKGTSPVTFSLFVNKGKWVLLDSTSKEKVVRISACFAAKGNMSVRVSGIVYAEGSNAQLGEMSLSGDVFTK